jgi:2-polyprenyl-3-methyl-5-hydroxy-6-metoxy-1,4-benzoquinol methylase
MVGSLVPSTRGKRALDLGCGSGFFSGILVEKGWYVTAVDVEAENVAKARRFAQDTIVGDAMSALDQLRENSFELVLVLELIEHLPDGKALLEGLRRVTSKDGQLIISTPNRMSPEGLGGYYWGKNYANGGSGVRGTTHTSGSTRPLN